MGTDFPVAAFLLAPPWAAGAEAVVLAVTWAAARHTGRHSVVDTAWGLLFGAVAVAAFVQSAGFGDDARRLALLGMTLVWGLRLAGHIYRRSRGAQEDPRYRELLADRGAAATVLIVYAGQGILALVISAPILVGAFEPQRFGWVGWLGIAVWTVGMVFETVGDAQLRAHMSNPRRSPVLDRGLWRFTRHPNYFGDACVWVGVYLVAAGALAGVLTVFSPILMVYLLVFGSGKRLLERRLAERPPYRAYMEVTSGFFPWPPRRAGS